MPTTVILTCHPDMGRPQDREVLQHNRRYAEQVASAQSEVIHVPVNMSAADASITSRVLTAVTAGYRTAIQRAGDQGRVLVLLGHGSGVMADMAPPNHMRVTVDVVRTALARIAGGGPTRSPHDELVEALMRIRDAFHGHETVSLDLGTCSVARGTGTDFLRQLQVLLGARQVRGLDGWLVSQENGGRIEMGVTTVRSRLPREWFSTSLFVGHWLQGRRSIGTPQPVH